MQLTQRLIGQSIESACADVSLKLLVPYLGIKLEEPPPKSDKLLRRKPADRSSEVLNHTHNVTIRRPSALTSREVAE